jgi:hypothetical protein
LDVPRVQGQSGLEKTFVQAAGGGKTILKKNVACMFINRLHKLLKEKIK